MHAGDIARPLMAHRRRLRIRSDRCRDGRQYAARARSFNRAPQRNFGAERVEMPENSRPNARKEHLGQ